MMPPPALLSLGTRIGAGHGVWSVAAFLFPTLAIVEDGSVALAMLLFGLETLLGSTLIGARVLVTRRAIQGDDAAGRRLQAVVGVLRWGVAPFGVACAFLIGAATILEHVDSGRFAGALPTFAHRASWMTTMLLAGAVLDSLMAPVRSVHWLETAMAWQLSRTFVLFLVMMVGWPVMLLTGTTQSYGWIFFAVRLLTDLGGLTRGERERIRSRVFDGPAEPDLSARDVPKAPPSLSTAHARHDVNESSGRVPSDGPSS